MVFKNLAGLLKSLLSALLLIVALLGVGGFFMRSYVIKLLKSRVVTSASVIVTRPFPLAPGLDLAAAKVSDRLQRLGYTRVETSPKEPGQYFQSADLAQIHLHGFVTADRTQDTGLVSLSLQKGRISALSAGGKTLNAAWLEPEPLSLLGSSPTRVSSPERLSVFPPELVNAILAIEDERFHSHFGVDPVAVARALVVNLERGRLSQGGSTLTQQLAKNLFLTQERSLWRKIVEAFSAVLIETAFTKDQILEFYLNEVFLSQEGLVAVHGFGEAARSFFGKDIRKISLAEAATLAGMIKAPTRYSPRRFPERAKERRAVVLEKMEELKYISGSEREKAEKVELTVIPAQHSMRVAPYFVDYVRRVLEDTVTIPDSGDEVMRIYSGIDREYQSCAEKAVKNGLEKLVKGYPRLNRKKSPLQSALVSVVPSSGEILAWVGGKSYAENQFDRVSLAKRQPGSAFKPFVYLTALDGKLNNYRTARTTSILDDQPISFDIPGSTSWSPQNFDHEYRGEVTVRQALTHSLNVPTVNLALKVGIDRVRDTARLFGFGENLPAVPSIALGAGEVSPLELTRAYGALANGGAMINFRPISEVTVDGKSILRFRPASSESQVASEAAIYVLTNMLQSVVENGTAHGIRTLGYTGPVAGKTGTSNDARDAWFAGFTPHLLTVVWVGFDDNKEIRLTGGQAAVPIWTDYMKCVRGMEPPLDFVPPPGVVYRDVDPQTGLLATSLCPITVRELFVEGTEPVTLCTHDQGIGYGDRNQSSELPLPALESHVTSSP